MKKAITATIQIAVTILLLWWIFKDPEKRVLMWQALQKADLVWFLPAAACVGVALIIQCQRWWLLLRVQNAIIPWFRALKLLLIGVFFNMFLLGATGGDVIKIFYAMKELPKQKSIVLLSIFIDRIMGLLALAAVSVTVIVIQFKVLTAVPEMVVLISSTLIILAIMLGCVFIAWVVEAFGLLHKLPSQLPMRATITDFAQALSAYTRKPWMLLLTFLMSIPSHLLLFLASYFVSLAFTANLSVGDIFTAMPIVLTITALPISFSGVGVREGLFQEILGKLYGTPESIALLISIGSYMVMVVWSLIGGLVYVMFRSGAGPASLKEIEASVEQAETGILRSEG